MSTLQTVNLKHESSGSNNVVLDSSGNTTIGGGLYLGGTGAANFLNDYESGTWTPADGSGAGLTFSTAIGHYVKIGGLCNVFCYTVWPSTSAAGNVRISGLPFTVKDISGGNVCGGTGYGRFEINGSYYPNVNGPVVAFGLANTSNVDIYYSSGVTAMPNNVMGADQSAVDRAGNKLIFELTYMVA